MMLKKLTKTTLFLSLGIAMISCTNEDSTIIPELQVPTTYNSASYDSNVTAEDTVIGELLSMTAELNTAEANAQTTTVASISFPQTLATITQPDYRVLVDGWLTELVNSANSTTGFQNPGLNGSPMQGEQGGLLGTRLLDENGLELEQMIEKGLFGAALYNHAIDVIQNGDLTNPATIDRLVEVHGTDASFDPATTTAAAKYSKRRSNLTDETGLFFDIKRNLLTAKAAIEGGADYNTLRDQALADYLLNWEKSNFATVIFYCYSTKVQLQNAQTDEDRGNAMHAYAEGVAFAHGFKRASQKLITDAQIDQILVDLLAPEGQTPESFRFLNEATLINNLDRIVADIQMIYGFTDEEVQSFYVNN